MAETRFTESEAILYAVREDEAGLAQYLEDPERFTKAGLRALADAASALYQACMDELSDRG
jgi:hypothetical protein